MPHHHDDKHANVKVSGEVADIFAHRFVLKTNTGNILADLTPRGAELITLRMGEHVTLEGEQKPSEIKVARLTHGDKTYDILSKAHEHDAPADPAIAMKAAEEAGFEIIGEARRKPKHFEILGRKGASFQELHIELDGHIRKMKPAPSDDHKWQSEIESAQVP